MKAKIISKYPLEKHAKIIAEVLEADNRVAPESLFVKSYYKNNVVYTEIETPKIETLIATIDDLLSSQKLSESILGEKQLEIISTS